MTRVSIEYNTSILWEACSTRRSASQVAVHGFPSPPQTSSTTTTFCTYTTTQHCNKQPLWSSAVTSPRFHSRTCTQITTGSKSWVLLRSDRPVESTSTANPTPWAPVVSWRQLASASRGLKSPLKAKLLTSRAIVVRTNVLMVRISSAAVTVRRLSTVPSCARKPIMVLTATTVTMSRRMHVRRRQSTTPKPSQL
ncbi:hypothetical protein BDZ85DRAFT_259221 [Elsinoe ampelina]|uniref:Uncharacterized protein n=1 Tax=Elsinoe ampelina TaxID=302913 RepID=A0A6A6GHC5_9PEZI|nr:hypothetical protein BDZ85DRAFT_259221 [Elsinoe ampelina]